MSVKGRLTEIAFLFGYLSN